MSWQEQAGGRDRAGLLELRDPQVEWQGQTFRAASVHQELAAAFQASAKL